MAKVTKLLVAAKHGLIQQNQGANLDNLNLIHTEHSTEDDLPLAALKRKWAAEQPVEEETCEKKKVHCKEKVVERRKKRS